MQGIQSVPSISDSPQPDQRLHWCTPREPLRCAIHASIHPSIYAIRPCIQFIHPFYPCIHPLHPCIHVCTHPSVHSSMHPPVPLFMCLFVCLPVHLSCKLSCVASMCKHVCKLSLISLFVRRNVSIYQSSCQASLTRAHGVRLHMRCKSGPVVCHTLLSCITIWPLVTIYIFVFLVLRGV